jgi:hypothetical protein
MHAAAIVNHGARRTSLSGRAISALVVLFMVFDGAIHVLKPRPVADAFAQLGYPLHLSVAIGVVELICTVLYVIPRTSVLGALLLTAYLGGAIATQLRVEAGWFPLIFPVLLGGLVWGGLALRDPRVRALLAPPRT